MPSGAQGHRQSRSDLPAAILDAVRAAVGPISRVMLFKALDARWAASTIDANIEALVDTGQLDRIGSLQHRHYAIAELD